MLQRGTARKPRGPGKMSCLPSSARSGLKRLRTALGPKRVDGAFVHMDDVITVGLAETTAKTVRAVRLLRNGLASMDIATKTPTQPWPCPRGGTSRRRRDIFPSWAVSPSHHQVRGGATVVSVPWAPTSTGRLDAGGR